MDIRTLVKTDDARKLLIGWTQMKNSSLQRGVWIILKWEFLEIRIQQT